MLSACGGNNTQTLKSDDGIAVVGEFEKGAELKTDKVEVSSDDADTIFGKLEGGNIKITTTSNAMIYDIFVSKDDKKVQPNGKVAVSVPVTESANGYKVFHIKDDNTIEELSATYKDGILTFETSSFSYFVIVPTGDVLMNIDPDNPTPDTGDDTPTAETIWESAITTWQGATNVKVVEHSVYSTDDPTAPVSANRTMFYQFDNNKYSEDGYFDDEVDAKDYKGKATYYIKENETTYSYIYYRTTDWETGEGKYVKDSENHESDYKSALARTIYGWCDSGEDDGVYTNVVDFSSSNFEYDETSELYKSKDGKNITVELSFESGELKGLVITMNNTTDKVVITRTITFDAVVEIPTVE